MWDWLINIFKPEEGEEVHVQKCPNCEEEALVQTSNDKSECPICGYIEIKN